MILNSSKTIVDRVEDFVLNSSFEILNPTSVAFKAIGDGPLKKETVIKELVEIAIYAAMEKLQDNNRKLLLYEILRKIDHYSLSNFNDGYKAIYSLQALGRRLGALHENKCFEVQNEIEKTSSQ
ncbi:unnamed protein product [Rhizophagus irregularis]|nr:unnamed protein product [Rhizophagus irregularis]